MYSIKDITTRGGLPAVCIKVRHGFEKLTDAEWAEIREDIDLPKEQCALFTREWCQAAYDKDSEGYWWNEACTMEFEQAEQDAKALFGDDIECEQDGRSGGWLVVKGLPDLEDWSPVTRYDPTEPTECSECGLPDLAGSVVEGAKFKDGTELANNATLLERWTFFEEQCEAYAQNVPYLCAQLMAMNKFQHEETKRPVQFLRAWSDHTWSAFTLYVPQKIQGVEDLLKHVAEHPEVQASFTHPIVALAVLADPFGA